MVIVYYSFTGQIRSFISKIDKYESYHIDEYNESLGDYVLITPTHGFGEIPDKVKDFLDSNHSNMVGVAGSGRQIWKLQGTYCKGAKNVSAIYGVPMLHEFEMKGTDRDREILLERIEQIEQEKLH